MHRAAASLLVVIVLSGCLVPGNIDSGRESAMNAPAVALPVSALNYIALAEATAKNWSASSYLAQILGVEASGRFVGAPPTDNEGTSRLGLGYAPDPHVGDGLAPEWSYWFYQPGHAPGFMVTIRADGAFWVRDHVSLGLGPPAPLVLQDSLDSGLIIDAVRSEVAAWKTYEAASDAFALTFLAQLPPARSCPYMPLGDAVAHWSVIIGNDSAKSGQVGAAVAEPGPQVLSIADIHGTPAARYSNVSATATVGAPSSHVWEVEAPCHASLVVTYVPLDALPPYQVQVVVTGPDGASFEAGPVWVLATPREPIRISVERPAVGAWETRITFTPPVMPSYRLEWCAPAVATAECD